MNKKSHIRESLTPWLELTVIMVLLFVVFVLW